MKVLFLIYLSSSIMEISMVYYYLKKSMDNQFNCYMNNMEYLRIVEQ